MALAGKKREARECLLHSLNISKEDPSPYAAALSAIYADETRMDIFSLLHYTNVLICFAESQEPEAVEMGTLLLENPRFRRDISNRRISGHPWNRILWHVARYARTIGE